MDKEFPLNHMDDPKPDQDSFSLAGKKGSVPGTGDVHTNINLKQIGVDVYA